MSEISGIKNTHTYHSNDGKRVASTGQYGRLWRCYEDSRQVGVTRDLLTVGLFVRGYNPALCAPVKTWCDDEQA